jgi:4-hydroxybenzoate polyprenyltransferase
MRPVTWVLLFVVISVALKLSGQTIQPAPTPIMLASVAVGLLVAAALGMRYDRFYQRRYARSKRTR